MLCPTCRTELLTYQIQLDTLKDLLDDLSPSDDRHAIAVVEGKISTLKAQPAGTHCRNVNAQLMP